MEEIPIEVKIECPDTDGKWPQSLEWSDLPTGNPITVSVKTESQSGSSEATENALLIKGTKYDDSDCDEACPQPVFVAIKEEPVEEMGDVEIRENDFCLTPYAQGSCNESNRRPRMECSFETTSTNKTVGMNTQGHSSESAISFEHIKLLDKTSFAVGSSRTAESQDKQVVGEEQSQSERAHREMQKSSMKCSFAKSEMGCREKRVECPTCKKQFPRKSILDTHKRVHSGEKPFKCSQCEKSFSQRGSLTVHMRSHTGERPYRCSQCDESFHRSYHLTVHMRFHTGERPYKCSRCDKSFQQNGDLVTHMRIHTGERPYKCSHCQKSFSQRNNLTVHMRSHSGEKPFKCSQCGKSFGSSSQLNIHRRIHIVEKPYKCTHCEKSFRWCSDLTVHVRSHTGERPFKCSQCDKSFYRGYSLTLHIRSHTGERPHKCGQCDKSFSLKSNLTKHMEIHK